MILHNYRKCSTNLNAVFAPYQSGETIIKPLCVVLKIEVTARSNKQVPPLNSFGKHIGPI